MKQRRRIYYSAAQRSEIWDRYRAARSDQAGWDRGTVIIDMRYKNSLEIVEETRA